MAKTPGKAAAKKPAAKKPQPKGKETSVGAAVSPPTRDEETMSIRKIKNGYVVRRSWTEGSGMKTKYREEEVFTPKKPVITV